MSDLDTAQAALIAQIAASAANGGLSAYTQGDLSVTMRDPLKDLELLERIEERLNRSASRSRLTQGEVVDPE